ncbi:MAG: sulfatase-like hydrolase/transferase [Vicinamibacterales bacterium]
MRTALTRTLTAAFWIATAIYALLSVSPFASQQFLQPRLVPAIAAFATWHAPLSLAALVVAMLGLLPYLRSGDRVVWAFSGMWLGTALLELLSGGLASLQPNATAVVVAIGALVPPVWLALLDLGGLNSDRDSGLEERPSALADFAACGAAALLVTLAQALLALNGGSPPNAWWGGVARSAILHLAIFSAIFAVISIVRGLARPAARPGAVETWLARIVVAAAVAAFIERIILAALGLTGPVAIVLAIAFGIAGAVVIGPAGTRAPRGVEAALAGVIPNWAARSPLLTVIWTVAAMGAVAAAQAAVSASDWNFTVARTIAAISWLVALGTMLRVVPGWLPREGAQGRVSALAPFAACLVILGGQQFAWGGLLAASDAAVSSWTSTDMSSRLIVDALAPPAPADGGLYAFLQRNTNIPHDTPVAPVNIEFAPLGQRAAHRPHVFLFVVDSLRRDYLSPYNPDVAFTPAIARFAAESTVFTRAFTRYGATGLAVPSIWAGGMLLHKQYVTPFAPMNTLDKLLTAEDYRRWMSMEHIVETITPPTTALEPLDAGVAVKDQRLCRTLEEVRGRLDRMAPSDRPTFVYSLPQDVHISTVTREGNQPVDSAAYTGFNAAYASRVRRFDTCFGAFVDDLKARGLYDDSLIVLTSDHGDSLGEQGRMGHAYTVFPEVIQVPLLMHLPASLRADYVADPAALSFTSDLTPTLYALLGHAPSPPSPIFGRPLYGRTGAPRPARRETQVVASSYGSVYGALLDDAKRLYIIDAVSLREYEYELDGTAAGRSIAISSADREAGQKAVRAAVDEVSRVYAYHPDQR